MNPDLYLKTKKKKEKRTAIFVFLIFYSHEKTRGFFRLSQHDQTLETG